ncbi:hypothetical protein [Shinella sp.]|uniref:hypothetical protein n=1 Tax=Shinella sp. TaxID=1870904 RepID=UPI003F6EBAA0
MEKQVVFRDRQELDPADLNGIQEITRASLDRIVKEAVTDEARYAGLATTATSATAISVAQGCFVTGGEVYGVDGPVPFNLYENLPVQYKRYIAIVASGEDDVDDQVEERDFLIDADSDQVEPQAVPMRKLRQGSLTKVVGTPNIDPQLPTLPPNSVLVAKILFGTTGIDSIVMEESTKLPSLKKHGEQLIELENFRKRAEPQIGALTTQMSVLFETTNGKANRADLIEALVDLARVKEAANLPDSYSAYASDDFANDDETDPSSASGHTLANGALGFASTTAPKNLQLLNPTDPLVRRWDTDWITPAHEYETLLEVPGSNGDLAASSYQTQGVVTEVKSSGSKQVTVGTYTSVAAAKAALLKSGGTAGTVISETKVKQADGSYKTQYVAKKVR